MPLDGKAFIAMWHDIAADKRPEYLRWHSIEHMPERVGIPGFNAGRRYINYRDEPYRYFTMYEGSDLATFSSAPYLARLNAPTDWTVSLQPAFENFVRYACTSDLSIGAGVGQSLVTLWLQQNPEGRGDRTAADRQALVGRAIEDVSDRCGLVAGHFGWVDAATTSTETKERELRADMPDVQFDAVVLLEAVTRNDAESAHTEISPLLDEAGFTISFGQVYELSYYLAAATKEPS